MFWFATWMTLNVLVTLLNKAFFSNFNCPYPASVTMIHLIMSAFWAHVMLNYKYKDDVKTIQPATKTKLNRMSLLFVSNIVLGNMALSYCSIAFVQMVRCTIPAVTAAGAYFILGDKLNFYETASLAPVVFGAVLVCLGEVQLTFLGFFLTMIGCLASSLKSILTKVFLSGGEKVHSMQLLRILASFGAVELFPFIFIVENDFITSWVPSTPVYMLLLLICHGCMAFTLNMSNFEANKETNPLLITVGGNVKQVFCMILSIFLFDAKMSGTGVFGAALTIGGAMWHGYERYKTKTKKRRNTSMTSEDLEQLPLKAPNVQD